MNKYNFSEDWDRKPGVEEETLLKKFIQRSLTKVHLSVIVLDVKMYKGIRITQAKVEFGLRFKK